MSEPLTKQEQPKKRKPRAPLPSLAVITGADQMAGVAYAGKVDNTPIEWASLPRYSVFSASADGSYPKVKISKTQYADLRTNRSEWCGGGRCYRVLL